VPDTQVEQNYRSVRQRIIDGVYLPSERLVETDLAQSMVYPIVKTEIRQLFVSIPGRVIEPQGSYSPVLPL